ncbi:cellulose biosynthesis cyclic di-GMP-binding regulatory protein BcsB [Aquibaculum sediminis]|uniref:cellulose biosynthesis cyclic di-GMP-binding regulatory protein BcsB n=1 Tax=Aquibaculum sediminis TaxID=3231907 RepID=UPI0034521313
MSVAAPARLRARLEACRPGLLGGLLLAILLLVSPLAAQEEAADPTEGEAAGTEEPGAEVSDTQPSARIIRRIPLARLGHLQGLALEGVADARELRFPLPHGVSIEEGWLGLGLEHVTPFSDTASLRLSINGMPRATRGLAGEGESDWPFPLDAAALSGDSLSLGLDFRASRSENRCLDERTLTDFVRIGPGSGLHLAIDAHSVQSLASAWSLLPQRVTVSLGREPLTPGAFAALLEITRRLQASGREVRTLPLPEIPADAPVGQLASGLAGARSLLFEGFAPDESFGIGHIVVAARSELAALEGAVAQAQERFERFSGAAEGEMPLPSTRLQPQPGDAPDLRLVRFLDYPVIAAGSSDPEPAIGLLTGPWSSLADSSSLRADLQQSLSADTPKREGVTFAELGFDDGLRSGAGRSEWLLDFALRDLPQGRLPTAVELQLILPGAPDGTRSGPLDVYFNDSLLASIPPGRSGERRRETLALPTYLIGTENRLRVVLHRTQSAGDCALPPADTPAQLLASSRVLTEQEAPRPRDFYELISHMGQDPLFLLPESLLADPAAALPLLARVSETLLPARVRPRLRFFGESTPAGVDGPFLLFGQAQGLRPQAPLDLSDGQLTLRDGTGRNLLQADAPLQTAVVQLARLGEHSGLWVLPDGQGRYPTPPSLSLGRNSLAWIDDGGVALALQTEPEAAARLRYPWAETWLELLDRHRHAILAGGAVLLTLLILALITRQRRRRRRDQG